MMPAFDEERDSRFAELDAAIRLEDQRQHIELDWVLLRRRVRCLYCGTEWYKRVRKPKYCIHCHRRDWDLPPEKRRPVKQRHYRTFIWEERRRRYLLYMGKTEQFEKEFRSSQ